MIAHQGRLWRGGIWILAAAAVVVFFWSRERSAREDKKRLEQALKEPWAANPKFLLPLFGGGPKTEEEKRADQHFVELAVKGSGNSELAAVQLVRMGWDAYRAKNFDLAMSRFNQAWLVNPNNGEIYWGFGLMTGLGEKIDDSIGFLKKAVELVPHSAKKARLYCDLAYAYSVMGDPVEPEAAREKIYAMAEENYKLAEAADPDLALTQSHWSMLLFKKGKYKQSWERASRAKKLGGEGLDPEFVQALEAQTKKPLPKS